jgi:hypothetical protein
MSSYFQGLITGTVLIFSLFILMGQQDLDKAEERANNRFDEIVKALEIIYTEIGSTSDHHFVKLDEVEKKIERMETLVVEMFNYGIKCKL